jgi:hypothetical protein
MQRCRKLTFIRTEEHANKEQLGQIRCRIQEPFERPRNDQATGAARLRGILFQELKGASTAGPHKRAEHDVVSVIGPVSTQERLRSEG